MADLRPPADRPHLLPDELRPRLATPWAIALSTDELAEHLAECPAAPLVAVGDVVSLTLKELGLTPRLFICDYKTQRGEDDERFRRELGSWGDHEIRVSNPPAVVTREGWDAVADALARPPPACTRVVVEGEEDLLALPCFLLAPLGAIVLYGAPGRGVVPVDVDAALKERVTGIVEAMAEAAAQGAPGKPL
ncbi:MAG: GTP-dependent dephospho-CoA kinase family protein [Thermoplasmatota archaeon]